MGVRGPHDVGGLRAGPIDRTDHALSGWEKDLDAMNILLRDSKRRVRSLGGNRPYVEALGHELYNTLTYYERWTAALCRFLIEKGVLTQDEIDAKVTELQAIARK